MRLNAAEAERRLSRVEPDRAGMLLYGPDPMLVAMRRRAIVAALVGPGGEAEMRLDRVDAADLRRDPVRLSDGVRAKGFFPGHRVVVVEEASDAQAGVILELLADHRPGDAEMVVTAGPLGARSTLRKGFEAARRALAVALYPDPPGRREIEGRLAAMGIGPAEEPAIEALVSLGAELDPGDFAQILEKLALYRIGASGPLGERDVAAVAPVAATGEIDEVLHLTAEGDTGALCATLRRLAGQGANPTTLVIAAERHFRALHAAAAAPGGVEAALGRLRPPVFGERRARMGAAARRLGQERIERALVLLTDTDLALRSARPVPGFALLERALIRIAKLPGP